MKTYKQIVEIFEAAATAHIPTKMFAEGAIDYLDANSQNIKYPFMFLRPLVSPGLENQTRTLTFELYSLDVPKLSDQSPLLVKSNTELWLYDIISYLNYGPTSDKNIACDLVNMTPVNEAFNDRVYGWVAQINVTEDGVYNYCNFPG